MLLYGGSYEVKGSILFIRCGNDEFKVNLFDGRKFGKYTFFHKNKSNKGYFHKQLECKDLEYGLFRCFTHNFNKLYNISYSKEDWWKFEADALKYKILN
jgi:hypothetical protein